ncbi:MAG: sodium-translocating pyrophosphatase [Thermoguttaceae bacterium]|nr:sodium-translocating pyrophosphatase [Thermoguttaceae bacterium]
MIQRLKQRWLRDRRLRAAYLVLMMVLFVAGWLTLPVWSADEKTPAPAAEKAAAEKPAAAAPAAPAPGAVPPTPVVPDAGKPAEHAKPKLFAPLTSFPWGERIALVLVLGVAIAGLVYAGMLVKQVREADQGTPKMQEIASAVREGADAYLWAQFRKIGPLIVLITIGLYFSKRGGEEIFAWGRAGAFLVGSLFSWTVGFVGMKLATTGNLRVAAAAKRSYGEAMQLGYRTGTITGMLTDGLGLLGGTCIFLIYGEQAYEALLGFGFGGTLLALFMRVGGGIYTKAADVGADLVGKVEAGIPEDDPRNAATIADNVGDNVGDCAGMAADIFESYEVTIVAAMILGLASFGHKGVIFPLLVRGIGVLGSIISTYTVKAGPNDTSDTALKSVHRGFWIGSLISIAGFFLIGLFYLHFDQAYFKEYPMAASGFPGNDPGALPAWANFGMSGLDMRPALTCLIGVFLAIALNKVTSYYTHTSHSPVKTLARSCQTGHATNIIQGFAVGYESTVAALLVIAGAIVLSVLCYWGTPPVFIAFGVAMTGIGMLTLTGNTISMDVFGPVADNANGIGEMGYDKDEMGEEYYKRARRILADLDAVGNTTKAETKGIAIGSAVIAAVSLFASFIAVIAVGSEDRINQMTTSQYFEQAGKLTVAEPLVLVGFLIGGAVPFLFSSMLIRAVGRAAFYIVNEVRQQFKDPGIMAGTKKPNYGRVVDICTSAAQAELIGPGLLAILAPTAVGFLLGPYALGGFLAGMILVGQLLAVFMANAGGAWDNAKKMIEDEPRTATTGKGSEKHKAAVTGDTVGDPLKDTAGPAINPLVKVMNMVSLLGLGLVLSYNVMGINPANPAVGTVWQIGAAVAIVAVVLILWAVRKSKHETAEMRSIVGQIE